MQVRQQYHYPPFQRMARLIVRSKDEKAGNDYADRLADAFRIVLEKRKQEGGNRPPPARSGGSAGLSAQGVSPLSFPACTAPALPCCIKCCAPCCRRSACRRAWS